MQKTTRCVTAHEAVTRGGFGAELAAVVQQGAFDYLDAPIERVGAKFAPLAFAPAMEQWVVPHAADVLEAVERTVAGPFTMATEVKLPRLGQGMESGTIVKWLKGEGEPVKKREPLYELDTDKVTQEVEAEADGVLLKIVVDSGEVEVGRTIAFIGDEGEEVSAENGKAAPKEEEGEAAVEEQDEAETEGSSAPAMDDQRQRGQEAAAASAATETAAVTDAPARPDGRVKASPLARRLARERGSTSRRSRAAVTRVASSRRTSSAALWPLRRRRRLFRPLLSPLRREKSRRSSSRRPARRSPGDSPKRGRHPSSS